MSFLVFFVFVFYALMLFMFRDVVFVRCCHIPSLSYVVIALLYFVLLGSCIVVLLSS